MDINKDKNKDASSKLAEAIAGQDINSLKEMILDQMGIDNQDELIDRVLDIIDDEDENTEGKKEEAQVVELYKNPEEQRTDDRSSANERQNERKQSKDSKFDPLDLLLNNKDLIFNMVKDSIFNVKPEDDARVQLLYALKPFCNDKRQGRIDNAVKMMGITRYFEKAKKKE